MRLHCKVVEHHGHQFARCFDLRRIHVAASVGVAEYFLADWNGPFDLSLYEPFVEELEVHDVEVKTSVDCACNRDAFLIVMGKHMTVALGDSIDGPLRQRVDQPS